MCFSVEDIQLRIAYEAHILLLLRRRKECGEIMNFDLIIYVTDVVDLCCVACYTALRWYTKRRTLCIKEKSHTT